MSKWRPTKKDCIYICHDLHGNFNALSLICDRVLPLRKSDGGKDRLIFLGDYIDRNVDSHKIIDFCIELKKKYGEYVQFICGNHELMLMHALNILPGRNLSLQDQANSFKMWTENGGRETIYGYFQRGKEIITDGWQNLPRFKVLDLIPKSHIEFFQSLIPTYELDGFLFGHANPLSKSIKDSEEYAWDFSLANLAKKAIQQDDPTLSRMKDYALIDNLLSWDKMVIIGHASNPVTIYLPSKFLMCDVAGKQVLVTELKSMTAYMADSQKQRLVKFDLQPTKKIKSAFKRVI